MSWREILNIDRSHELKNRTWWWWWFIFFFSNPTNPSHTKQMVLLWGTRNCRKLIINDHPWCNDGQFHLKEDGLETNGVAAGWYFDGETMHDPLFIDTGKLEIVRIGEGGTLSLKSKSNYVLDATRRPYHVAVNNPDVQIHLTLEKWKEGLDPILITGKDYLGHLGYQMHKIRGTKVKGSIAFERRREDVTGTSYFQNVRINSPTSPWYWGVFQSENGSYIDYFLPHIGPPALRRVESHESKLDWGERMLSKGWQFIDGESGTLHRIKKIRISKSYQNDLPIFYLEGEEGLKKIRMEMQAYARAYWKIVQPFLGLFNTVLYYNEYPVNMTKFDYRNGPSKWTLADLGRVVGNCEHSWGMV